jgi:hypothetical protein
MKKIYLTVITVISTLLTYSQAAKSTYFELGGPGLASINFDTRFGNREDGLGGRIGIGGFSVDGESAVFVPVGLNYLLSKDSRNYLEVGAGVTPVFLSGGDGDTFSSTFGHLIFGYRMQPRNGGFMFRAFVCPVFGEFGFIPYYAGLSFGYKF